MIEVTVFRNEEKQCVGFQAVGHAGYAEEGQDIVCAAASVLMINTVNAIERFTLDRVVVQQGEAGGYLSVHVEGKPSDKTRLLLDTMLLGLESMEDDSQYERYIDIIFEEV